jgi:hypothetical protein
MINPITVAQAINKLKPDLKEFWEELEASSNYQSLEGFNPVSDLDKFKMELRIIYLELYSQRYLSSRMKIPAFDYISYTKTMQLPNQKTIGLPKEFILGHVENPGQYLNKYLRTKLELTAGTKRAPTAVSSNLQANAFSLQLFDQALAKQKKVSSADAIKYFEQIKKFPEPIFTQFLDTICKYLPEPSQKFQDTLANSSTLTTLHQATPNTTYIRLQRWHIRHIASQFVVPLLSASFGETDSAFVPFICGIPRKPTPTQAEVDALVQTVIVIGASNNPAKEYIISCLKTHLAHPAYKEYYAATRKALLSNAQITIDLLKDV